MCYFFIYRYVPNELRGGMISLSQIPANAAILFCLIQVCVPLQTLTCFASVPCKLDLNIAERVLRQDWEFNDDGSKFRFVILCIWLYIFITTMGKVTTPRLAQVMILCSSWSLIMGTCQRKGKQDKGKSTCSLT